MNITDLDDKIIRKANEEGVSFLELSRKYETEFFEDMKNLNVELPDVVTRVSEYIEEIKEFIQKIVDKGYAYKSNGSVYFNVAKFNATNEHKYPKLLPTDDDEKTTE